MKSVVRKMQFFKFTHLNIWNIWNWWPQKIKASVFVITFTKISQDPLTQLNLVAGVLYGHFRSLDAGSIIIGRGTGAPIRLRPISKEQNTVSFLGRNLLDPVQVS
jgi:hypothetical protein